MVQVRGAMMAALALLVPVLTSTRSSAQTSTEGAGAEAPVARVSVKALRHMRPGSRRVVEIEATVCYCDPIWHFLFLVDGGHGIFAVGNATRYRLGDRLRVRGAIGNGHGSPILAGKLRIEKLGEAELDPPPRVTLDAWTNDAQLKDPRATNWIEVAADVEQAGLVDGFARLWCRDASGALFAVLVAEVTTLEDAWKLVGGRIAIRGALGLLLNRSNEIVGPLLLSQSWSQVDVATRGSLPPLEREARIVGHLPPARAGAFHACGQVSYVEDDRIFVDDGFTARAFRVAASFDAPFDRYVHLYGVVENGERVVKLIRAGNASITIWPKTVAIAALAGTEHGRRATIQGRVVRYDGDKRRLILGERGARVVVRLPSSTDSSSIDLSEAREVKATGVLLPEREDALPILGVMRHENCEIQSRRFILPSTIALWALGFFLVAAGLGLVTVSFLRRQVAARTRKLSELAAQLRASHDSVDDGLVAIGRDASIFAVNRAANTLLGAELAPGDHADRFLESWRKVTDDVTPIFELASASTPEATVAHHREVRLRDIAHGVVGIRVTSIQLEGEGLGTLWLLEDETNVRTLQASLLHAQKMEAVGALSSAIAHDFNNLLTAITGTLGILRSSGSGRVGDFMDMIDAAEGAAFRAGDTVRKLLTFGRTSELQLQVCRASTLLEKLRSLLRHGFDASIEFEFCIDAGLPAILADPTQIEHVLLNLCVNARDAMPDGGLITIGAFASELEARPAVAIYVRDTGPGIPADLTEKIFEPFLTTKDAEQGSGLGLAISFGIVRQHGGLLTCTSREGEGSEFHILLPTTDRSVDGAPDIPSDSTEGLGGTETILAIDDEWVVRTVTVRLLEDAGYTVLSAESGAEGLAVIEAIHEKIDLVLVDVTMPRMSGHDVARSIRERFPKLPIVMCSGYSQPDQTEAAGQPFVAKPFKARRLLTVVRRTLDGRRAK